MNLELPEDPALSLPAETTAPSPRGYVRRFAVRKNGRITLVKTADIDWIEGAGDYVRLHRGNEPHLLRASMVSLLRVLDPDEFVRIHRSAIIRIDRIKDITPLVHGDLTVTLENGTELRMSRRFRRAAETQLGYGF